MLLNLLGLKGLKEDGMEKGLLGKKNHIQSVDQCTKCLVIVTATFSRN